MELIVIRLGYSLDGGSWSIKDLNIIERLIDWVDVDDDQMSK